MHKNGELHDSRSEKEMRLSQRQAYRYPGATSIAKAIFPLKLLDCKLGRTARLEDGMYQSILVLQDSCVHLLDFDQQLRCSGYRSKITFRIV